MSTAVEKALEASAANKYPFYSRGVSAAENQAARQAYRQREHEIMLELQNDLIDEFAADLPKTVGVEIFSRAWDAGHSEGYVQVGYQFEELAEFARMVRSAK